VLLVWCATGPRSGPGLAGDLNRDGVVDFADLGIVLSEFGQAACAGF